ncbi:hypothetical protein [Pseudoalteromonas sp. NZS11_1]|uniref:hypothetical protein n=1 Tax=Pseudoalteromonas sp. NZS11_1 TaxID=2792070 RepID=UPI0018CDE8A2|nr:hypothetical protein [Pseudoalteromonas sp. NZS11_1]MBH0047293.1 hypothetical protein [Pseudoalteromonas sp. NZS11_1]
MTIRAVIKAPSELCIYRQDLQKDTYSLIKEVDNTVTKSGMLVTLDLREVKLITAAASVLLFATVSTCQLMNRNPKQVMCIFPKESNNSEGYRYIVKTGLARALHSGELSKLDELVDQEAFFQSSNNPFKHAITTSLMLADKTEFDPIQYELLSTAIGEAMLNVHHHAYNDPLSSIEEPKTNSSKKLLVREMGRRWWQCAWYDYLKHEWVFIICDFGVGIPQSLMESYNKLNPLIQIENKEAMIKAFTIGGSRFNRGGRGNGSEDMKRAVGRLCQETDNLLIYSGGVKYQYSRGMVMPQVNMLATFFGGTLIEWTLKPKLGEE